MSPFSNKLQAITRGDMIKIDKWIESMPHERRKDAFKFSTSENATALKFAVLENKPSIARAFLNAAGERELNSDIENVIRHNVMYNYSGQLYQN